MVIMTNPFNTITQHLLTTDLWLHPYHMALKEKLLSNIFVGGWELFEVEFAILKVKYFQLALTSFDIERVQVVLLPITVF